MIKVSLQQRLLHLTQYLAVILMKPWCIRSSLLFKQMHVLVTALKKHALKSTIQRRSLSVKRVRAALVLV
jgi:hypothetical protein